MLRGRGEAEDPPQQGGDPQGRRRLVHGDGVAGVQRAKEQGRPVLGARPGWQRRRRSCRSRSRQCSTGTAALFPPAVAAAEGRIHQAWLPNARRARPRRRGPPSYEGPDPFREGSCPGVGWAGVAQERWSVRLLWRGRREAVCGLAEDPMPKQQEADNGGREVGGDDGEDFSSGPGRARRHGVQRGEGTRGQRQADAKDQQTFKGCARGRPAADAEREPAVGSGVGDGGDEQGREIGQLCIQKRAAGGQTAGGTRELTLRRWHRNAPTGGKEAWERADPARPANHPAPTQADPQAHLPADRGPAPPAAPARESAPKPCPGPGAPCPEGRPSRWGGCPPTTAGHPPSPPGFPARAARTVRPGPGVPCQRTRRCPACAATGPQPRRRGSP